MGRTCGTGLSGPWAACSGGGTAVADGALPDAALAEAASVDVAPADVVDGRWSALARDGPRPGSARRGAPPGRRVSWRTGGRAPGAGFVLVIAWFLVITLCMADPRFARPVSTGR
ncbi:hypothetical protein SY2F82_10960 [Streptomyces sp. Y2F8-2]|nr:hypothetical protein SY2F82_10960 [Streptomyces sp. Y2F8-2]